MQIQAFGSNHIGKKRRQNEDALLVDSEQSLFVVCDGMGGHAAGEVASRSAIEFVGDWIRERSEILDEASSTPGGYYRIVELAERAVLAACEHLHEMASQDPELAGMGTTLTLLMIVDNKGIMAHVGDSRLYLMRDQKIHQLSNDHTLINEMIQRGAMTLDEAEASPYKNVLTRLVGSVKAVEAELLLFDLHADDTFLICTDGMSNYLEDTDEHAEFLSMDDVEMIPEKLIDLANLRGGGDNITNLVVRVDDDANIQSADSDSSIKTCALTNCWLGANLSYSRLIRLSEITHLVELQAGTEWIKKGDLCEGMFAIVDGSIGRNSEDDPSMSWGAGDCLFDTALVGERSAKCSLFSLQSTRLLVVPRVEFRRLAKRFPRFGNVLYRRLLAQLSRQVDEQTYLP